MLLGIKLATDHILDLQLNWKTLRDEAKMYRGQSGEWDRTGDGFCVVGEWTGMWRDGYRVD